MDGRKAGKASTRRTLAVAASRGVSLRHAEDAPLVFFIISFSPGHQRVQNESQAMYKKTHKKGNMEPKEMSRD